MTNSQTKHSVDESQLPFSDTFLDVAEHCAARLSRAKSESDRQRVLEIEHFMCERASQAANKSEKPEQDNSAEIKFVEEPLAEIEPAVKTGRFSDKNGQGIFLYNVSDVDDQMNGAMPGSENSLYEWLSKMRNPDFAKIPFVTATEESISDLEIVAEQFPNFRVASEVLLGAARLSMLKRSPILFPNLLLDGPPGIGKTAWLRACADALVLPMTVIPLASLDGRFELIGGHRTYRGAEPGLLVKSLLKHRIANMLFLFDEAEFADSDLYHPLYSFIEDQFFTDHFLEIDFLVEHVNIALITNDRCRLPDAIRSRAWKLLIQEPSGTQKLQIIDRIYQALRTSRPDYLAFPADLDSGLRQLVANRSLRQARISLEVAMLRSSAASAANDGVIPVLPELLPTQEIKPSIGFM